MKFLSLITRPTLFKKTINIKDILKIFIKKYHQEIFTRMLKEKYENSYHTKFMKLDNFNLALSLKINTSQICFQIMLVIIVILGIKKKT